jgi:hypothetical protein
VKDPTWLAIALVGAVCAVFAIFGTGFPKGAGLFPMLTGSLGAVTAILCLFWQWRGEAPGGKAGKKPFAKGTLWAVGMTFGYPLLVFLLGYVVGTISFTLTLIRFNRANARSLLGFALLALGLWAVFSKLLLLRLPSGVFWQLLS